MRDSHVHTYTYVCVCTCMDANMHVYMCVHAWLINTDTVAGHTHTHAWDLTR